MKNLKKGGLLAALLVAMASPAMATGLDYSTLTDAISFDEVGPAVLAGAGALVALYVIVKGVRLIISFVRGG